MLIGAPLGFFSGGPLVVSIQQVAITIAANATTGTATISSVPTATSSEHLNGYNLINTGGDPSKDIAGIALTNSTTLTATRNTADASNALTVYASVIQWNPAYIKSIQRGTIALTGANSNTASIAFTLTNSVVQYNGLTTTYTSSDPNQYQGQLVLTAGTVTATRGGTTNNMSVYYTLIEFNSGILNSSTQQGVINSTSASTTATITSVTTAQTMLIYGGWKYGGGAPTADVNHRYVTLTDSTTVTGVMSGATGSNSSVAFGVIEFKATDIKSVNRSTINLASGSTSNTASISAVTTSKCIPNWLGNSTNGSGTNDNSRKQTNLVLTNTTTLTAARNLGTSITCDVSWEAIEFK